MGHVSLTASRCVGGGWQAALLLMLRYDLIVEGWGGWLGKAEHEDGLDDLNR